LERLHHWYEYGALDLCSPAAGRRSAAPIQKPTIRSSANLLSFLILFLARKGGSQLGSRSYALGAGQPGTGKGNSIRSESMNDELCIVAKQKGREGTQKTSVGFGVEV